MTRLRSRLQHHGTCFAIGAAILMKAPGRAEQKWPADLNFFGDGAALTEFEPFFHWRPDTAKKTAGYGQFLLFCDGRHLTGELVEVTKDEVVWRRPDTTQPLRFPRRMVRRVNLATDPSATGNPSLPPNPNSPPAVPATLKLPGGDWLFGDVSSTDGQSFALQPAGGPRLTVSRAQIEWLYFAPLPFPGFGSSGSALDMEGWTPSCVTTETADGTVTIQGATWIGREIIVPKRFEVAFEVPEEGDERVRLGLERQSPRPNNRPDDLQILFRKKEIGRVVFANNHFERQWIPLPKEVEEEKGPVRYRVFYDGLGERLAVQRNGREVANWDQEDKDRKANRRAPREYFGLSLDNQERGEPGSLKLNRLRVLPWDGVLPGPDASGEKQDRFSAGKTPAVPGQLASVTEKNFVFSGETHPREIGNFVHFPQTPMALAGADAKLELRGSGELNTRHFEIRDGRMHGETIFAPSLELPLGFLRTITFQNYPPPANPSAEVLVFKNSDELPGHALSAASGGPVRWQTLSGQELEIQPARIAGIRRSTLAGPKVAAPSATVELRNGDRWRGQFMAFDDQHLQFQHAQFGAVSLARDRVWHLFPNPQLPVLDGGSEPLLWTRETPSPGYQNANRESANNSDPWIYLDGTYIHRQDERMINFSSTDVAALEHAIDPALERFEVRLDATSMVGSGTNFVLSLLGQAKDDSSLTLSASHNDISFAVMNPKLATRSNWQSISLDHKLPVVKARLALRLFVDLKTGSSDLFVDDVHLGHLGDDPTGRLVRAAYRVEIRPYPNGGSPNAFSNLWVGPWSGDLPQPSIVAPATTALGNGDLLPAIPKGLHDGKWTIESDLGPLEVPAEKVVTVDFGGTVQAESGVARVRLTDGSTVHVDTFQWDGRALTAHSSALGKFRLPENVVAELIFDPVRSKAAEQKSAPRP